MDAAHRAMARAEWREHWRLPLAAALGFSTVGLQLNAFGPFIVTLQAEFGWDRAQVVSGITVANAIGMVCFMGVGVLMDRIGPRAVGLTGVLVMTAAFALLGTATGSLLNWRLLWIGIAIGTLLVQAAVWTSAVASRFEAARGLALAVTLSGGSIASTFFPLIAATLNAALGWRMAFPAMAALWAVIVFPVVFLFFRGAQDERGRAAARPAAAAVTGGLTVAQGLRLPAFWKLLLTGGLFSFCTGGIAVHLVPILASTGLSTVSAAGFAGVIGICAFVAKLTTGWLLDRWPANWVGAGFFVFPLIGCILFLTEPTTTAGRLIAVAGIGISIGAELDVLTYLATRHFGLLRYGALFSAIMSALAAGTAFGPLTAGLMFDADGSYAGFLKLVIGLLVASAVTLASLGRTPALETQR